jgi:hypothetical protein
MAEQSLLGKDVLLYKYNTVDEAWEPIACATSNSFGSTTAFKESITKCDEATRRTPTTKNFTAAVELVVSTKASQETGKSYLDDLEALDESMTIADYALLSSEVSNKTIEKYFRAYIESIDITAAVEEDVTASVTFAVDGGVSATDPFPTT